MPLVDTDAIVNPGPLATGPSSAAMAALCEFALCGMVVFDSRDRLSYANQLAREWLGTTLVGGATRREIVELLDPSNAELARLRANQKMIVVAGSRLIEVTVRALPEGMAWHLMDSSAELRLRSQLAEEASFLAHSNEAFLVLDVAGNVRYANQFAERERGQQTNAMVGLNLLNLERLCNPSYQDVRILSADELRRRLETLVSDGGQLRYNAWHKRADGDELPVEVTLRPHRMSQENVCLLYTSDAADDM
jgi:PAS domain S-box-containing protein